MLTIVSKILKVLGHFNSECFEREDGAVETFWSFQEKVEYSLPYKWKVSVCVYNTLYKGFFVLFDEMRREKTV